MDFTILALLIAYIFPAYLANAVPVVFGGGAKIDGGRNWKDGRRLLGDGKTINGFLSGVALGTLAGAVLAIAIPAYFMPLASLEGKILASFLLALGALCGDLAGSFLKRRMNIARGQPSLLMDQLLFLFFALGFSAAAYPLPGLIELAFLVVLTFVLHIFFNFLAHRLKLKSVPW